MSSQTCLRCGWIWEVNESRNVQENCQSCRTRKRTKVDGCIVWQGHYAADLVTPMDEDGEEVLPGYRTCLNKDCINVEHIIRMK